MRVERRASTSEAARENMVKDFVDAEFRSLGKELKEKRSKKEQAQRIKKMLTL